MKVTVTDGKHRITRDLPILPKIGDDIQIGVPGTPTWVVTVKHRRWIFQVGNEVEVELDCS